MHENFKNSHTNSQCHKDCDISSFDDHAIVSHPHLCHYGVVVSFKKINNHKVCIMYWCKTGKETFEVCFSREIFKHEREKMPNIHILN